MEDATRPIEGRHSTEGNESASSNKRPRSPSNDLPLPKFAKTVPSHQALQINYLQRLHAENLPLVNTEDSLPSILRLIGEYEGVLHRHESIAGNLGACPLGPILLKRFERLFDGPPHILKSHGKEANVTWLDVVEFARNKPEQFNLEKMRNGVRVCQFYTKQCRVEISEEDFVLIASGMPQKLIPPQPIVEDEEKELGAIQILEKNLGQIVQLADQLSGRARQLNHKLGNRKNAILRRRETDMAPSAFEPREFLQRSRSSPMSPVETNGFAKRQQSSTDDLSQSPPSGFTAVNVKQSIDSDTREPDPRLEKLYAEANTGNVTIVNGRSIKGASPTLRAELMKRFFSSTDREARAEDDGRRLSSNAVRPQLTPGSTSKTRPRSASIEFVGMQNVKGGSTVAIPSTPASLLPQVKLSLKDVDDGGPFKSEMVSRMETMARGERVIPPCDRCRRLHMDCLKNLTACMGCTKKHAKCSWKDVRVDELQRTNTHMNGEREDQTSIHAETRDEAITGRLSPPREASTPQTEPRLSDALREVLWPSKKKERQKSPAPIPDEEVQTTENPEQEEAAAAAIAVADSEAETDADAAAEKPKFDVRPPPMAQQQANGRGQYTPFPYYSPVKDSIEQDENDEGDRLQALAAQVYRSASQSVRPQTQEG